MEDDRHQKAWRHSGLDRILIWDFMYCLPFSAESMAFASTGQTRKLIEKIREWDPDVIHLHNIHGFILQVEELFSYLKQACKPVVWTLHDCWPYTGHCAFYDYTGCDQWRQAVNIVGNIGRPTHMRCSAIIRSRIMCERRLHLPA